MTDKLPLVIEPEDFEQYLGREDLLILDLSNQNQYLQAHVPGAIHVPPSLLQCGVSPTPGKLPNIDDLNTLFSELGLTDKMHVVAYDDEGGGWAGRLIWTLDVIGHKQYSYLNGGIHAWAKENHPVETIVNAREPNEFSINQINTAPIAEASYIIDRLGDADFAVWDARSRAEYDGIKVLAEKGGHIPGAVHYEWFDLMDRQRNLRLLDLNTIQTKLDELGLTIDKEIVTHCQTHHRSGLTYLVGKLLGYNIKGYHGSWGEWGNMADTPISNPSLSQT